jgi:flagellar protein FliS
MTDEKIKEYTLRITQANASQYVLIVYELFYESVAEARTALKQQEFESYRALVVKATKFVEELIHGLNFDDTYGKRAGEYYLTAHRHLIQAKVQRDASELDAAEQILRAVEPTFVRLAKEDSEPPMMANTQKVYAGLTYGRKSLSEVAVDPQNNRGYTV